MGARKREPEHGGPRPGSGRKSFLKDPIRRVIIFEGEKMLRKLKRYAKKNGLEPTYSQAVRHMVHNAKL